MSFRKILVAVDESAFAARAADVGFDLARSLGAEVAIIHVVDPSVVAYAPEGGIPASELIALAQQAGKRLLAAHGQRTA
ncbi:MAG TPA: universal stress protein, partial [Pyrinomonadaceae bacterium]|nr:universal stress protein [Pyrinomonadaceae bacterium]